MNDSTNGLGLSMMTDEDIDIALKMLSTHSQIEQHLREENELLKRELESRQQGSSAGTSFESSKEAIESEASERSQAKKKKQLQILVTHRLARLTEAPHPRLQRQFPRVLCQAKMVLRETKALAG